MLPVFYNMFSTTYSNSEHSINTMYNQAEDYGVLVSHFSPEFYERSISNNSWNANDVYVSMNDQCCFMSYASG